MKPIHIWLIALSAPLLFGQASPRGKLNGAVTLDQLATWGGVALPKGSYSLAIQYARAPVTATLRSADGKTNNFEPLIVLAGTETGHARICLVICEGRWCVRSVELPELGISLLFLPRNQPYDSHPKCIGIEIDHHDGL